MKTIKRNKYFPINTRLPQIFILLAIIMSMLSCSEKEKEEPTTSATYESIIAYDLNHETEYPISIINAKKQTITMIKTDENGKITSFDCLMGEELIPVTATFNEDGLLSGIGTNGATIAFSNYNGNKVDIAVIVGEETLLLKEFESEKDWDEIKNRLIFDTTSTRSGQTNKEERRKVWKFVGDQLANIIETTYDGIHKTNPKRLALEFLFNVIKDSTFFVADFDSPYTEFITEIVALVAFSPSTPWGALYTLLSNYDTYEKFVEDMVYYLLEMHDQFMNDWNNGVAALNSGYGELKATLTWNFYADIDLHAIEPSGTHIYWKNPKSYQSGGFLDIDNRRGGNNATENIYWEEAEDGEYEIYIDYYSGSTENGLTETGNCIVSIYYNGHGKTYNIPINRYDMEPVTVVTLPEGKFSCAPNNKSIKIVLRDTNESKP